MTRDRSPLVGLITIWYRTGAGMDRFVSNLRALRYPHLQPVFVIHSLAAPEVERLRALVPEAVLVEPQGNLGPAAGWNLGIRHLLEAGAHYVGIWNVDVRLDPGCLQSLVAVLDADPTVGACQPLLFYSDEPHTVQMYGGSLDPRTGATAHDYRGATDLAALPPLRNAGYLDGGTMLMRSAALRRVGGFDERLFMYAEDCDLCLRLQAAGYRTVAVRDAHAWHYHREEWGALPRPHQLFYETRNRLYLVRKHAGGGAALSVAARSVVGLPRRAVYFLRRGRPRLAWASLAGLAGGLAQAMGKRGWVE